MINQNSRDEKFIWKTHEGIGVLNNSWIVLFDPGLLGNAILFEKTIEHEYIPSRDAT